MKIELSKNKVFFKNNGLKKEIHPFWLRERVNGDAFVDKKTQQRLFDPAQVKENIKIIYLSLSKDSLEIIFNDGAFAKLKIKDIFKEFSNINEIKNIKKVKWDSALKKVNYFKFKNLVL